MEVKKFVDAIVAHNRSVQLDWVVMHGRGEGGPMRHRDRDTGTSMEVKKIVDAIVAHNCSVQLDWVVMHGRGEGGPMRHRD
jgi:1,4-alpha-glucan branching enzyme